MPFKDDLDDFTNSPLDDTVDGENEGNLSLTEAFVKV